MNMIRVALIRQYSQCHEEWIVDYSSSMEKVKDVKFKIEEKTGIPSNQQQLFLVVGEEENVVLEYLKRGVVVQVVSCPVATVPNEYMGPLLDNSEVTVTDEEIAHYLNFGDTSGHQTVEVNITAWWLIDLHFSQQTRVVSIMDSVSTLIQDFRVLLAIPNSQHITVLFNGREFEQNSCPFLNLYWSTYLVDIIVEKGTMAEEINQNADVGECSAANQILRASDGIELYFTNDSAAANDAAASSAANQNVQVSDRIELSFTHVSDVASSSTAANDAAAAANAAAEAAANQIDAASGANQTNAHDAAVVGNVAQQNRIQVKVQIGKGHAYFLRPYPTDSVSTLRALLAQRLAYLNLPMPRRYHFSFEGSMVNEEWSINDHGIQNRSTIFLIDQDRYFPE